MSDKFKNKKGQIVLFVIVLLTIALIIVTSVLSRSLTSVKNTTVNTDSTRAFNAAESGIAELLNNADLLAIVGAGNQPITSVDQSNFIVSKTQYNAVLTDATYFETRDAVAKDTTLQIEFTATTLSSDISDIKVHFKQSACVLISAINTIGSLNRYFICGTDEPNFSDETVSVLSECDSGYTGCSRSNSIAFPAGAPPYALLIKVLNADSKIRVTATNYDDSFKTKNITGTAWATTKSNVKKEIEVITKTTKDVYPVFDYALYLRTP